MIIIVNTLIIKYNRKGRCMRNEDDISAEEETESESSWLQSQNEYSGRKKGTGSEKS